jgi:N-acetylmuramoyl-L-alanine amidase
MKSRALSAQFVSVISVLLVLAMSSAHAASIKNVRVWRAPDNTRIVLDLSGPAEYKLFDKPGEKGSEQRIEIAIEKSDFAADTKSLALANTPVASFTHEKDGAGERVFIDLRARVKPKSFLLPANEQYGDRLVIDLFDEDKLGEAKPVKQAANGVRDILIAVDPGHGGEDPGAKGPGGIFEKNVTLAIAKELVKLINDTPGYSAFLTRTGDYYVSLRGRTQIARNKGADMFVSIHADAFSDNTAQGASVFALSQRGATSETARWLEKQENNADLVGGVNLGDKDPMLQGVLLDLSMTATISTSMDMGDAVLNQIKKITPLHRGYVEQAGFVVLKNPDIPSLLVETGFITNAREAQQLANPEHRAKLAKAVFVGIDSHFRSKPPMDTAIAAARGGKVKPTTDKLLTSDGAEETPVKPDLSAETDSEAVKNPAPIRTPLDDAIAAEDSRRDVSKSNAVVENAPVENKAVDNKSVRTEVKVSRDTVAARNAAAEEDAMEKMLTEKSAPKPVVSKSKAPAVKMPAEKNIEHVVKKGETLSGIAQRYKVSVVALQEQNKLSNQNMQAGQKLRIPVRK